MRVMLDTNIFISMIFFPSNQTRELAEKLTERHQIIVCDYVVEELRLVTDRKFPAKRKFLDCFFRELPFELVYTPKTISMEDFPDIRDTKDLPILATAILENVDVFITGDKDFLVLDVDTPDMYIRSLRMSCRETAENKQILGKSQRNKITLKLHIFMYFHIF